MVWVGQRPQWYISAIIPGSWEGSLERSQDQAIKGFTCHGKEYRCQPAHNREALVNFKEKLRYAFLENCSGSIHRVIWRGGGYGGTSDRVQPSMKKVPVTFNYSM